MHARNNRERASAILAANKAAALFLKTTGSLWTDKSASPAVRRAAHQALAMLNRAATYDSGREAYPGPDVRSGLELGALWGLGVFH